MNMKVRGQVFSFFAGKLWRWFDKGSNCIFSIAHITTCIQTMHAQFLTEQKSLFAHNAEAFRGTNAQVLLLQPAQQLTHTHNNVYWWQPAPFIPTDDKNKKQQTLSAGQASESKAFYKNIISTRWLWMFCTESPITITDLIVYTTSMYLSEHHVC